jgi:hypothetical protein
MFPWQNPVRAARRNAEAVAQNGSEKLRCIYCSNVDSRVVRPRRIQNHHFLARERDPVTVPLCLNCHAVAHLLISDADIPMKCEHNPTLLARAIFKLFAVHFSMLAEACWRLAKKMDKK